MSALLVIALGSVVVLAYINLNAASAFQAGYVLTNLANVQREVTQLHMETNRVLRDRSKNFEPLELRRARLDTQIELATAEAHNDPQIVNALKSLTALLNQYDYEIDRLRINPSETQFRSSAPQFDNILDLMDKQVETLYGDEEIRFYSNIGDALRLQRTSQTLTITLGGLLLMFGVLLVMSVGRSVSGQFQRAYDMLKREVNDRRRAEEELRHHNEYLAALHETSLALMNRLEVSDLLQTIVTRAAQLLGTEHGYIYLVNPAKDVIERQVGVGVFARSLGFHLHRGEGVAGKVWATGEPLIVNAYETWSNRMAMPGVRHNPIRAMMGAPLTSGQRVAGVIGLAYDVNSGRTFAEREVTLLEGFAQLASIALDNAQLFAEADQRTTQIQALYRADEELYRHLELQDVLRTMVDVAVDILKVDKSALLVWDATHTHLVPGAARGFQTQTLDTATFLPDQGLVGHVATHAEPVVVGDTTADQRVDWNITYPERIRSFIHVPILVNGEVFGIFNVNYTEPYAFSEEEQRLVLALAQRAALAIENARLYEQAQQAATLEERQRLARELHDAVTQTLFSASIIADVLPRLWQMEPEEAQRRLRELRELTRGALAEMRTLLLELRPTALSEADLGDLMHQLAEATTGRARVPVDVCTTGDCRLPSEVKVALYRIAQEALNNVAKHANAQHVEIQLRCEPNGAALHIHDDGVGFDVNRTLPANLGLRIMHERSEAVGAHMEIRSHPHNGTEIVITWKEPAATPPIRSRTNV
jgi:signal transduction histidine kinase